MDQESESSALAPCVLLRSTNGDITSIPLTLASQSGLLASLCLGDTDEGGMVEGGGSRGPLDTPLTAQQLGYCLAFMQHHHPKRLPEIERPLKSVDLRDLVPEWDAKFVELDLDTLYQIILAANFLDVRPLLDLALAKVATNIKGRSTLELRKVCAHRGRGQPARSGHAPACCLLTPPHHTHPTHTHTRNAQVLGIRSDYTKQEEEAVREENKWCEEGT
jgi:S-phase kinase-associated protein 1